MPRAVMRLSALQPTLASTFLCGQSPGAERSADDGLVAQHPGLDERAPAFASAMFISALARMSVAWGPA